jgi:hypothetical protein
VKLEKHVVHEMRLPYALGTLGPGPDPAVACGTEDHGPVVRIDPPYRLASPLAAGPGGCMGLTFDPGSPSEAWAIFGCFVGYDFQGGGLYRIPAGGEPERVLDLPYAHRLGFLEKGGRRLLVAASLAGHKKDASDWSTPGAVYAAETGGDPARRRLEPVLGGIHKNHGFLVAPLDGRRSLLIGGSEGLLAADLEEAGPGWSWRQVLPGETSEMALADLDGDGRDELVTIEPFHGNLLRAYRRAGSGWSAFWEAELQFGHGLWAGTFQGRPTVLVGNRAGPKDLVLFAFDPDGQPRRIVVDEGAGAANALVVRTPGGHALLSANQAAGQIALYAPRE